MPYLHLDLPLSGAAPDRAEIATRSTGLGADWTPAEAAAQR
jgi:hypothetical protein